MQLVVAPATVLNSELAVEGVWVCHISFLEAELEQSAGHRSPLLHLRKTCYTLQCVHIPGSLKLRQLRALLFTLLFVEKIPPSPLPNEKHR